MRIWFPLAMCHLQREWAIKKAALWAALAIWLGMSALGLARKPLREGDILGRRDRIEPAHAIVRRHLIRVGEE